jgi:hypothetical protein
MDLSLDSQDILTAGRGAPLSLLRPKQPLTWDPNATRFTSRDREPGRQTLFRCTYAGCTS